MTGSAAMIATQRDTASLTADWSRQLQRAVQDLAAAASWETMAMRSLARWAPRRRAAD